MSTSASRVIKAALLSALKHQGLGHIGSPYQDFGVDDFFL